jgi:hypothetical protein
VVPGKDKKKSNSGKGKVEKIEPSQSPIWKNLKHAKGERRTDGTEKEQRYYKWDRRHGEIEVYDRHGKHLGAMDPRTGEMIKPPHPGREIDV